MITTVSSMAFLICLFFFKKSNSSGRVHSFKKVNTFLDSLYGMGMYILFHIQKSGLDLPIERGYHGGAQLDAGNQRRYTDGCGSAQKVVRSRILSKLTRKFVFFCKVSQL